MGGVKKACGACQWTFDAVNKHIGRRLGYKLVASGSHGRLYAGWKLPVWLDGEAREEVKAKADGVGWYWRDDDALDRTDTNAQEPGGNPRSPWARTPSGRRSTRRETRWPPRGKRADPAEAIHHRLPAYVRNDSVTTRWSRKLTPTHARSAGDPTATTFAEPRAHNTHAARRY